MAHRVRKKLSASAIAPYSPSLSFGEAWSLSDQVADAFIAHYAGDEIPPDKTFDMTGISFKGKFLIGFKKNLVKSLYHDLYPADNFLEMKLR